MAQKRDKIEIIYDILDSIYKSGNIRTSYIIRKANLSHSKFKIYITELKENNLVIENIIKSQKFFSLTKKGIDYYFQLRNMKKFMETFKL